MTEFFVTGRTFAAPIFSESFSRYVEAATPEDALRQVEAESGEGYCYAMEAWASADDFHKQHEPLARWLSNSAIKKAEATRGMGGYGFYGHGPESFTIFHDGKEQTHTVEQPYDGRVFTPKEYADLHGWRG